MVDSRASMHMLNKKDFCSGELHTHPSKVQKPKAQVYVHDLDLFMTLPSPDDTLAVLSLGELCSERGCSCEWKNGETPRLTKSGKRIEHRLEISAKSTVIPLSGPAVKSHI